MRYRYADYPVDLLRQLLTMQELVKLFLQLVLQTGGDVEEALRWMKYLQERGMIDPGIDLEEFRKALQKSEIVEDRGGQLALSAAGERRIRRSALEEIFTSLTQAPAPATTRCRARAPGGELLPETRAVRVRRQPERDRRHPHDRQRRAARRRGHRAAAGGLRGPRGGAPDLLRDGARDRHLPLDDPLRRGPLHAGQEGRARDGRAHPVEVPQGLDRRAALRRRREARARSPRSRRRRSARSTPTRRPASRSRASSSSTARTRTSRSS